jgi:hypothetical protein
MRRVHSEGQRERNRMRNHTASKRGKYDLRARTADGDVIHVCRYSDESEARKGRERLKDADEEERKLIGLPDEYSLSVHPAA